MDCGRSPRIPVWLLGLCLLAAAGCAETEKAAGRGDGVPAFAANAGGNRPESPRFGRFQGTVSPEAQAQMDTWRARAGTVPSGVPVPDGGSRLSAALLRSEDIPLVTNTVAKFPEPIIVHAGMAIDNDGQIKDPKQADRIRRQRDPHHQSETSLRYRDGGSLDPTAIPYIVVPSRQKGLLGDLAVVSYRGRSIAAVVGDCGPRYGEASVALADALGVNSHGVTGGIASGVTYVIYPRSGQGRPADAGHLKQILAANERPLLADASSRLPGTLLAQR